MLRDDLARVRKTSTNIAEKTVSAKLAPLLEKIKKLEARIAKMERKQKTTNVDSGPEKPKASLSAKK